MTQPVVTMKKGKSDEQIFQHMLWSRVHQIPLLDGTGHRIGLAALEVTGDGGAGMAVVRLTMLVPIVTRKRWWRLVFRLKQEVVVNFRWIGTTVALRQSPGGRDGRGHVKTSAMVARGTMVTSHRFENVAYR